MDGGLSEATLNFANFVREKTPVYRFLCEKNKEWLLLSSQ